MLFLSVLNLLIAAYHPPWSQNLWRYPYANVLADTVAINNFFEVDTMFRLGRGIVLVKAFKLNDSTLAWVSQAGDTFKSGNASCPDLYWKKFAPDTNRREQWILVDPDSVPHDPGTILSVSYTRSLTDGDKPYEAFYEGLRVSNFDTCQLDNGTRYAIAETQVGASWLYVDKHEPRNVRPIYIIREYVGSLGEVDTVSKCNIIGQSIWPTASFGAVGGNVNITGQRIRVNYSKPKRDIDLIGTHYDVTGPGTGVRTGITGYVGGKTEYEVVGDELIVYNDTNQNVNAIFGSRRNIYTNNNNAYGYASYVYDTAGTRPGYGFYVKAYDSLGGSPGTTNNIFGFYADTCHKKSNNYYAGYFRGTVAATGNLHVSGFLAGSAFSRGSDEFSPTATEDTISIIGCDTFCFAQATWASPTNGAGGIGAVAGTNRLIIYRNASDTALVSKYNWFLQK